MSEPDPTRYQLTPADNRRIFEREIVPDLLAGREPQATPAAVYLLGQPGAGKTRVAQLLGEQLAARGGFLDIDSDLYKPYHPAYADLMAEDDRLTALYTGEDGRAWMRQAQEYARENRLNVLVQEIAMSPEYLAQGMRSYQQAGYQIEAVALAVHEALSQQGILHRYHEQVRDRGTGRLTVPEKAAASYTGILDSAEMIERERLAAYTAVYRRGDAEPQYANQLSASGERYQNPQDFRGAIERGRSQVLTAEETRDFLRVQAKLRVGLPEGFRPQLDRIEQQAAPILSRGKDEARMAAQPSTAQEGPEIPTQPRRQSARQDHSAEARPEKPRPDARLDAAYEHDTDPRTGGRSGPDKARRNPPPRRPGGPSI